MGEVLSQNEIDNLLAALSAGELDADQMQGKEDKPVKNYDFSRPTKFSKEHLRTLEIIFEHYSRLVSTNLPLYLRKNVQVAVASSETVTFNEFTNSLSNPVILGIIIGIVGSIGAFIGAKLALNINSNDLKKYFGIFLLLIAFYEIYNTFCKYKKEKNTNNTID